MASWAEIHRASEAAAIAAEFAIRAGRGEEAVSLYASAAQLEEQALEAVARSKARTRGITGVSAASLWFKARGYTRARTIAHSLMADAATPEFAKGELSRLLEAMPRIEATPRIYDVLLVEDQEIVRHGLRAMLDLTGEFRVVGEAGSGVEAIEFCRDNPMPDLVLMDLSMPGLNALEATQELVRQYPGVRVLILSSRGDERAETGVVRGGAKGYLLRSASVRDLLEGLRTVAEGGSYLSPGLQSKSLHEGKRSVRGSLSSHRESNIAS